MAVDEDHRYSHDHSERSHKSSSTAVDDEPKHHIHNHHHSSGICCSTADVSSDELWLNKIDDPNGERDSSDVERGPPNYERVVLLIDGLQCGCCEGGITRSVARIAAIREFSVNVVLARLELELDTNRLSVAEVINKLGAKTGYTFEEHIVPKGQVLELLVVDPALLHLAGLPFGTTQIETVAKRGGHRQRLGHHFGQCSAAACGDTTQCLVQVQYDPLQIGARDVYEYYLKIHGKLELAPPVSHPSLAMGARQTQNAIFWFIPVLIFTLPVVVMAWAPIDHQRLVYGHTSLVLATIVQLVAFRLFVPNALRSLWYARVFEMDFLIALSSGIAYAFSVTAYAFQVRGKPLENTSSFFETSTLLVTLILLGRVINEYARYRAAKSVSFRSLQADDALLVPCEAIFPTSTDPKTRKIDARLLQYGDTFKVAPHSQIVTDGIVLYGGSEVDESMITGESIPVAKGVHSKVFAGTTNGGGTLIVRLTALPHENSVHKIAAMVEDAELTKPRTQALADKVAGWFVPAMASIGLIVFVVWLLVGRLTNTLSWKVAAIQAVTYTIATLIVSCPCAIGLAVPMVVLIAGGVAARFGIIFRDPTMLETARNVTDVVFDKTGTLTCGVLTVIGASYDGVHADRIPGLLLTLLQDVKHPVAMGVLRHLEGEADTDSEKKDDPITITDITSVPGSGMSGCWAETGLEVRAGSPEWLGVQVEESKCTLLCITIGGINNATFRLQDRARHTAQLVIDKLHARGINTHMISGDGQGAVDDIAHTLGIPKGNTKARCKPEGKKNYVSDLQIPNRIVMFVGDGTNDSIALKQANVGVHINQSSSSDVAKSAADVVLMTTRLHDVLILLDISRAAYRRIILNFTWSAVYNVSAILLAAGAFTSLLKEARIDPQYAGLGELVSVLPVVLIAFQMRWRQYGTKYREAEFEYSKVDGV